MVVHEHVESSMEIADCSKPILMDTTHDDVKSLVKDLTKTKQSDLNCVFNNDKPLSSTENTLTQEYVMPRKKSKKRRYTSDLCMENVDNSLNNEVHIDGSDLQELKTVYHKCKQVMKKIEKKYGHLLDLDGEVKKTKQRKSASEDNSTDDECHCVLNKKIVFDDDGQQQTIEKFVETHICPKKRKMPCYVPEIENKHVAIEYNDSELQLPEDLPELTCILRDPNIEISYRNKVIEKMRNLKQDYMNELKFHRHSLIEKLKVNPDELLDFRGTNLSSLPGYCSPK